jgi:hypothetical protein
LIATERDTVLVLVFRLTESLIVLLRPAPRERRQHYGRLRAVRCTVMAQAWEDSWGVIHGMDRVA